MDFKPGDLVTPNAEGINYYGQPHEGKIDLRGTPGTIWEVVRVNAASVVGRMQDGHEDSFFRRYVKFYIPENEEAQKSVQSQTVRKGAAFKMILGRRTTS
jgi:hypothetical protein